LDVYLLSRFFIVPHVGKGQGAGPVTFSSFAVEGNKKEEMMVYHSLSKQILDSVFEVHRELGPGLLELPYRNALFYALRSRGLAVEMERPYEVMFHGEVVGEVGINTG
jgi:hypothetical protein